jgi:hypothetical protein
LIKVLKKELLIYFAILIALSLLMHPERIGMIESPLQLLHTFAWSFGAYLVVALFRGIIGFFVKFFRKK